MSSFASTERVASVPDTDTTQTDYKNRMVRLTETLHGRLIQGVAVRTPVDAAFDTQVEGRLHADTYHIKPLQSSSPETGCEPTFIIDERDVSDIAVIEIPDVPPAPITWLER
jgi:hypothetical protein